jgi:hypothetical protein
MITRMLVAGVRSSHITAPAGSTSLDNYQSKSLSVLTLPLS